MRRIFCLTLTLLLLAGCSKSPEAPSESKPSDAASPPAGADSNSEPADQGGGAAPSESSPETATKPDAKKASSPPAESAPKLASEPETVPELLSAEEIAEGWISLFDGYSMMGWDPELRANWSIEDGVLTSTADQKASILVTTAPWTDYELELDYRLDDGGNSGIFLRTAPVPNDPAKNCYELNLCDTHESFKTGSLVTRAQPIAEVKGDGGWHHVRVSCEGNWIQAWLDDVHMTDFRDKSDAPLLSGRIGLQKNVGKIEFRNVKLLPLSMKNLFDGKSLAGWDVVPGGKSTFAVEDGTIHVTNGAGFLETEGTYGDFVLQADFRSNGDGLNSGIFFRAMKGTAENPSGGYEFQLHSGIKNNDPRDPVDSGTGAIFRRVKARRVMSHDREWNTITLNASGDHFATWVNGLQVADWTDDRAPNENPRRGKRLDAGHLSLQGHDPTTDLNFRNLKIAEEAGEHLPSSF